MVTHFCATINLLIDILPVCEIQFCLVIMDRIMEVFMNTEKFNDLFTFCMGIALAIFGIIGAAGGISFIEPSRTWFIFLMAAGMLVWSILSMRGRKQREAKMAAAEAQMMQQVSGGAEDAAEEAGEAADTAVEAAEGAADEAAETAEDTAAEAAEAPAETAEAAEDAVEEAASEAGLPLEETEASEADRTE